MVSIERSQGWSRQLRLTPLSPAAYIAMKVLTALVLGACSVAAVNIAGILSHKPSMPVGLWIATAFSRVDRLAAVRRLRPVPRLPAAGRERPAAARPDPGAAVLRRRPVHPGQPVRRRASRTSPSGRRCTGSISSCIRRCSATASTGPGSSTCWRGWSSSPVAPCGGCARTPRESDRGLDNGQRDQGRSSDLPRPGGRS